MMLRKEWKFLLVFFVLGGTVSAITNAIITRLIEKYQLLSGIEAPKEQQVIVMRQKNKLQKQSNFTGGKT